MGKYTVYGKKVDLEVQKQLDKICKVIINYIDPVSIILIGGFGRGEGSIMYKKKKFVPINDYDIYAITDKEYPNKLIEKMCEEASKTIGKKCIDFEDFAKDMEYDVEKTFYPDIRVITIQKLRKLPCFLKYFEMRYGSIVIYGKNIINEFPKFDINQVPQPEGLRFLLNRLSLMIMHMPYSALKNPTENDKERIINFNMKTAMTCAEALLFYSKKFVASYKKRAEILNTTYKKDFSELAEKIPELPKIVKKYTNQKLKPDYNQIQNPVEDWFIIRDQAGEVLKFLLLKFTKEKVETWEQASKIINKIYYRHYIKHYIKTKYKIKNDFLLNVLIYPAGFVLNFLYVQRVLQAKKKLFLAPFRHPFIPPDLKLFGATPLVLFSLKRNREIDKKLFKKARKYLKQMYFDNPVVYKKSDWEQMRLLYGTAYRLYGFQKLI